MIERRHPSVRPAAPRCGSGHLWWSDARYKPERGKHLHVFLVVWGELADCLLAAVGNIKEDPDGQILPELKLLASTGRGLAIGLDRSLRHGSSPTANGALNAVPHHEVEPASVGADDGLPAFDRPVDRAWHESELFEIIAAIGHGWRQRVVFTPV